MINYISNPTVDLTSEFIFEFSTKIKENYSFDDTDFVFKLSAVDGNKSNSIKISNIPAGYTSKESEEYTLKASDKDCTYFNDLIIFIGGKPYKTLDKETKEEINNFYIKDGVTYVNIDKYTVYLKDNKTYIKRLNSKNKDGKYVRPAEMKTIENESIIATSYLADGEKAFDSNISQTYRVIISNFARTFSIWYLDGKSFKKIKTFSFSQKIEKGKIKMSIDYDMNLYDLCFSFFEA